MAGTTSERSSQLPDEMLSFDILKGAHTLAPRLGRLTLPNRKPIKTPNYVGITSRGIVPHLSQDTFAKHTSIDAVYLALEDCTLTFCHP